MTRYVKKPVTVDAFQMTDKGMNDATDWPDWLLYAQQLPRMQPGALRVRRRNNRGRITEYDICAVPAPQVVERNAWVVRDVTGKIWTMTDDIFRKMYEAVPEEGE